MQRVVNSTSYILRALYIGSATLFAIIAIMNFSGESANSYYSWLALCALSVMLTVAAWRAYLLAAEYRILVQIMALSVLWILALAISGGIANPANALLLLPVAIAFLTLSRPQAISILAVILIAQSLFTAVLLLYSSHSAHAAHAMHTPDASHYFGMSVTFYVAAILLAIAISVIRKRLERSQQELLELRENQLRQEQILAVATASAQYTHELATPLSTLSLLHEEFAEEFPEHPVIKEMAEPIQRVSVLLKDLRAVTHALDTNKLSIVPIVDIQAELREQITIASAQIPVDYVFQCDSRCMVLADQALLPALLNLVRNAAHEASAKGNGELLIKSFCSDSDWLLHIENPNASMTLAKLQQIGLKRMHSKNGLGIGMMLSHATLERFNGSLTVSLTNSKRDNSEIVVQEVRIPLYTGNGN
ncbi:MAG: hypothetical protein LAT53_07625 [Idiomarina sp.]|nr:hypothetical protein [Idiomarina sp.]